MQDDFSLEAYNYNLPRGNIAQHPAKQRDHSKLLVLANNTRTIMHKRFADIADLISPGDILVVNDTKVFPARLFGHKETGGKAEVFLLELPREKETLSSSAHYKIAETTALVKSSKRPGRGSVIHINKSLSCTVAEHFDNGKVGMHLQYPASGDLQDILQQCGSVPLPPYIGRSAGTRDEDRQRYQTVYANTTGAVAAPTAGLHFTKQLFEKIRIRGAHVATVTLHVGYGTFAPVRCENIREHKIHSEYLTITEENAERMNRVKNNGGKIWAVGTTTVRALEFSGTSDGLVKSINTWCDLYILPGHRFRVVDNLITNFHLPKSSLLFLVAALCGRKQLLKCYDEAIARNYRFYSYGDAMAILS